MAATEQTQAIGIANQLIGLAEQMMTIYSQMQVVDAAWTDQGLAAVIGTLGTCALNADGSIGSIDGTPNPAHPINVNSYGLIRALSSNQIAQIKTTMDSIASYIGGSSLSANPGARAILNAAAGG